MKKRKSKKFDFSLFKTLNFWLSMLLSLLVVVLFVLSRPEIGRMPAIGVLEIIEAKTLDFRFRLRGAIKPLDDVVIVAVDEKTEDELGRWQTAGRQWLAKLLQKLNEADARVFGMDLVLAEADEGAGLKVVEELKKRSLDMFPGLLNSKTEFIALLDDTGAAHDYDRQLTEAIHDFGSVVLGLYHFLNADAAQHLTSEKRAANQKSMSLATSPMTRYPSGENILPLRVPHSFGVEPNLLSFSEQAKSFGHFNIITDLDGVIRFTPLLMEYEGSYYASLAFEMARAFLNPPLPPIIHAFGEGRFGSIETIDLGGTRIPCDNSGQLFINYYGPGRSFTHYSLSDVILGRIDLERFKDKIVLLGFTSNIHQDVHSTPFQADSFPGVEINATIIENIIRREFLVRPEWGILLEAATILGLGILLASIRYRKQPLFAMLVAALGIVLVWLVAYLMFRSGKIWLNVTYPILFIVLDYLMITSYNYFTEERQKRGIRNAFQYYVSPRVVSHMLEDVNGLSLGGERKILSAFFSDIRGFTKISENLSPEELVEFLNEYLSEMTQIVLKYEGTVDKYMGDAIMAFYGAPVDQPDHAVIACKTAVDMMIRLKELQVGWEARGLPRIDIGIGINSGEMSVGNMGSRERFDYTIMGDNVNLASRLESLNKFYGSNIIISEFTHNTCAECREDAWTVRELDTVRVKGKEQPVRIYELFGYGSFYVRKKPLIDSFHIGLDAYKARDWTQALALFQESLILDPDDKPSAIYAERCAEYLKSPPPEDWDGVFVMTTK